MSPRENDAVALVDIPRALMRADLKRRKPCNSRFKDLTGRKFAWCQVVGLAGCLGKYSAWLCRCRCGTLFITRVHTLASRNVGCGCRGWARKGPSDDRLYAIYKNMLRRGKGRVCKQWRESFDQFSADMGPRLPRQTVTLLDPQGKYEPGNCKWGFHRPLSRMRYVEHNGKRRSLADWAAEIGVSLERMRQRVNKCIRSQIPLSEAVTTPAGEKMPSLRFGRPRINPGQKKSPAKIKEDWFNGEVHLLRAGKHFPTSLSNTSVRSIIQAEAETRGGRCKFRILHDCIMLVFEPR